jgi:hypothetical protein
MYLSNLQSIVFSPLSDQTTGKYVVVCQFENYIGGGIQPLIKGFNFPSSVKVDGFNFVHGGLLFC